MECCTSLSSKSLLQTVVWVILAECTQTKVLLIADYLYQILFQIFNRTDRRTSK